MAIEDAFFLDCAVTMESSYATNAVLGLDHLAGEEVAILADGKVHPNKTVTAGGVVVLDYEASTVHVGFPYSSTLESLPLQGAALQDGSSFGRVKEAAEVIILVEDSVNMLVGPDENNLDRIKFNEAQTYGVATQPFSGFKEKQIYGGHKRDKRVVIQQDQPLPLNVTAMTVEYDVTQR
jgi:hypothetical protein